MYFELGVEHVAAVAGLFGLLIGSFANVVIHRVPRGQSVVSPPSRCPGCSSTITAWQNIPILSWCLLRGRCANCRHPISLRYPLVEVLHGLGFSGLVLHYGLAPFLPALMGLFSALCILAFIDWDHQILPDVITLPGIALGLLLTMAPGSLITLQDALIAAVGGYLGFFAVAEGYSRLRGIEGLGMGDWKLAAMMGAFLGVHRLLLIVFLGSLSGLIFGLVQVLRQRLRLSEDGPLAPPPVLEPGAGSALPDSDGVEAQVTTVGTLSAAPGPEPIGKFRLPFGTFLAASAMFVLFCGDSILAWYLGLSGF